MRRRTVGSSFVCVPLVSKEVQVNARTAHQVLIGSTLSCGVFELVSTPFMDQPLGSLAAGIVFLAAAAWLWRGRGPVAPLLLGLLFAVELAGEPAYSRHGLKDWILQIAVGVLSLTGLVAAIVVVRQRLRNRDSRTALA
jgi:hypothetical protein